MTRSHSRNTLAFPIALITTATLALLPGRWLAGVQGVAHAANLPLIPVRDGAAWVAERLAPPAPEPRPDAEEGSLDDLFNEKEFWRLRYKAAEMRIAHLEEELEQQRLLPVDRFDVPVRTVTARITGHNPKSPGRALELNRGTRHGVEPGAIAVYNGVHLVGRVSDVAALRSIMVPITSPDNDLLKAMIVPADRPDQPVADAVVTTLEPTGDGAFEAVVDADSAVAVGDAVLLADRDWTPLAHAMILGTVQVSEPHDENPLRRRLVVRPYHQAHRLASVTLVMVHGAAERDAGAAPPP